MATPNVPLPPGIVWEVVNRFRRQPHYPTVIRMLTASYHGILAFFHLAGAGLLIAGRDALVGVAQDAGISIQASNSVGQGAIFLGLLLGVIGLAHGWGALGLFTGEYRYNYTIILNGLWVLFQVFGAGLNGLESLAQAIISLAVIVIFLLDKRFKAAYGKGRLGLYEWQRREAIRLGKPVPPEPSEGQG